LPTFPIFSYNHNSNLFITHFTKQMLSGVNTKEKQQKKNSERKTRNKVNHIQKKDG